MKKKPDMSPTETVKAMGEIDITGNVIPATWYQWIKFCAVDDEQKKKLRDAYEKEHTVKKRYKKSNITTPKTDLLAVNILADIVYWYRPTEVRDEKTGKIIEWRKKFNGKKLQRSYEQISNMFGVTKLQARRACNNLKALKLINTFKKDMKVNGIKLVNVMFMEPIPLRIKEITYNIPQEKSWGTEFKLTTLLNLNSGGSSIQIQEGSEFKLSTNTNNTTNTSTNTSTPLVAPKNGASAANAAGEGEKLNPPPESQASAINGNENSSGTNGNGSPDHDKREKSTTEERKKLLAWWNGLGIVKHKNEPKSGKTTLQSALDSILRTGETLHDICLTIENYRDVLESPQTRFNYKWGLTDFLVRGYSKFTDREAAFHNFVNARLNDNGRNGSGPRDRTLEVYESAMRGAQIADSMVVNNA